MNILLQTLLLVGGINLIAARYVPLMPLGDDIYRSLISQYNHGVRDYRDFHELFNDFSEEDFSKEPMISQTSDELDVKQLKELESFMSTLLSADDDDDNVDESKEIADVIKEITNEKDADDISDNDDNKDDRNEKNDDDKSDNNDDNDDKNGKDTDDISDNDDNDNDDKKGKDDDNKGEKNDDNKSDHNDDKNDNDNDDDNDDNDNNDTREDTEEETEIIDNSNEEIRVKPLEVFFVDTDDDDADDDTQHVETNSVASVPIVPLETHELSEKEIRELTAFLVTLSTMEDLLKVVEQDEDNSKDTEELFEQKLKEVDNFMGLFVNTLDAILEESSESGKDNNKSENDDDKNDKDDKDDSKDDNDNDDKDDKDDDDDKQEKPASFEDNNNDDASVSMEFHSVDTHTNTKNMDTHKYNIIEPSTTTAHVFKPTSSPYTPETYSSSSNPNAVIIHEYVEEREQLDELQENLLENKLNMDKDFYHVIANEGDDNELEKFGNDIAAMRENIFKMKKSIEAMQDIKSKLYFHQLIKSALKDAQIN